MKFFQKRWVAILLCILMIVSGLAIGQAKNKQTEYAPENQASAHDWAQDNYEAYLRYIYDDAGLLSDSTVRKLSEWNAAFDYSHDSICGVGIVDGIDGNDLEDAAFALGAEIGLGENDYFLLLDADAEDWYFVYGDEAAYYVDNRLEILVTGAMASAFRDTDDALLELFRELEDWYQEQMPVSMSAGGSTGMEAGGTIFFVLLLVLLIVLAVISSLLRAGRRVIGGVSGWWPLFFVGRTHHRRSYGPGPRPGPHVGPRPGPKPRPGGSGQRRSAGGFGGSSRGNFSRGGGFGGGNRGGGFGGRR